MGVACRKCQLLPGMSLGLLERTWAPSLLGQRKKTRTGFKRGLGFVLCVCTCVHTPPQGRKEDSGGLAAMRRRERCLCRRVPSFIGPGRCCREPNGMCIFSFLSRFPFYYELKIAFVAWLLSPYTKGSSLLYRKFVHPTLSSKEKVTCAALPFTPSSK